MKLFVVIDTVGCGRVLGVFDSERKARKAVAVAPAYYKLHELSLNELNASSRNWTTNDEHRRRLEKLFAD